jgi:hypothetical protein
MTKKLEELFGFDQLNEDTATPEPVSETLTTEQTQTAIIEIDATIDKIDDALPAIRNLEASDKELDEIADLAKESFQNLSDLAFNVDSRFSSELFAVAGTMLGHALTAKTTKLNKKLKMIDLQLKKLKLDQDAAKKLCISPTTFRHPRAVRRVVVIPARIHVGAVSAGKVPSQHAGRIIGGREYPIFPRHRVPGAKAGNIARFVQASPSCLSRAV